MDSALAAWTAGIANWDIQRQDLSYSYVNESRGRSRSQPTQKSNDLCSIMVVLTP